MSNRTFQKTFLSENFSSKIKQIPHPNTHKIPEKLKMNSRDLAAFLSTLISELVSLLMILFPSSQNPLSITSNSTNLNRTVLPIIHNFISSSEIAASLSLLNISKKRKRIHLLTESESEIEAEAEIETKKLDDFGGVKIELGLFQNPDSFNICFKMSLSTFKWLSSLLEPLLDCRDPANAPLNLSSQIRLGIGLYRLSTGADYAEISQRFRVSEFVARFCVKQLCRVLCTNFRFWVGFPGPDELESVVSSRFESLTGLPNCCGVINCTSFAISRYNNDDEELGDIAAQIVVDSSSRILSIFAGFRGDKDDLGILKSSTLYEDIENGNLLNAHGMNINGVDVNQYLVGDRRYPLLQWLMVPFVDPTPGSYEENFNKSHQLMRLCSVNTIASLRNWGILSKPIVGELKTAVAYIGACSILHNVLLMRDDSSAVFYGAEEVSIGDQIQNLQDQENLIDTKGFEIRRALASKAKQTYNLNDPVL